MPDPVLADAVSEQQVQYAAFVAASRKSQDDAKAALVLKAHSQYIRNTHVRRESAVRSQAEALHAQIAASTNGVALRSNFVQALDDPSHDWSKLADGEVEPAAWRRYVDELYSQRGERWLHTMLAQMEAPALSLIHI